MSAAAYPEQWESDVVLADGGTVHVRPITADDAGRLVAFHARLSPQTVYYRFFAAMPRLAPREVERFTQVDHDLRAALVALLGDEIVGVVRYDRLPGTGDAEVAFVVQDAHQGRGLGSVLLEHLNAAARERGISRFVAEVLPDNRRMLGVFRDAGFRVERTVSDGVVHLEFPIEPTSESLAVMRAREHRAESRSIARLLTPRSVAVVGASREPGTVGHRLFTGLLAGGFQGPVYPVNPVGGHVASVRAYPSVLDIPDDIDLAVLVLPAEAVLDVVRQCAAKRVRGLVVISAGFGETGPDGLAAERELVRLAHGHGMRVLGPNCLGIINTNPGVALNATIAPALPLRGRVGLFSQSGALGVAILETAQARGLGLSTFVSAGNRADVSGNDLLQFCEHDEDTDVVLLHLETFGNPRKFARLARRVARSKPVVAVKSGRTARTRADQPRGLGLDDIAVDALFAQAGVVRVTTLAELFDAAQVLALQPLPAGRRVAVVGNSAALGVLAADACPAAGLEVSAEASVDLGPAAGAAEIGAAVRAALPVADAAVVLYLPPLVAGVAQLGAAEQMAAEQVAAELVAAAAAGGKPVVASFLAVDGVPAGLCSPGSGGAGPGRGSVPSYSSPAAAVAALGLAAQLGQWRARPEGQVPELDGLRPEEARALVHAELSVAPEGRELAPATARSLLAAYGVDVWPSQPVDSAADAVAAADSVGYPVALKARAAALRHRIDLGGVRLDLGSPADVAIAYDAVAAHLPQFGAGEPGAVVQTMAPPGVAVVVGVSEDPSFGALVSFGLAGVATALLGDRAYRILPLTDIDVGDLVRSVRAFPLLWGWRGATPVDVPALEELLLRVARLADDLPEVAELELHPVVVAERGVAVLQASVRVAPAPTKPDSGPRRL